MPSRSSSAINLLDGNPSQLVSSRRVSMRDDRPARAGSIPGNLGVSGAKAGGHAAVNDSDITTNPRYKERVLADEHLPSRTVRLPSPRRAAAPLGRASCLPPPG